MQKYLLGAIYGILVFTVLASPSQAQTVQIGTSIAPPYQIKESDKIKGSSVELVRCVMDKLSFPYDINIFPRKRNQLLLQEGVIDIGFSFRGNDELSEVAYLSAPLLVEKWYWYGQKDRLRSLDQHSNTVVVAGSNQEKWLKAQGFNNIEEVINTDIALKMLSRSRADVALLTESHVLALLKDNQIYKDIESRFHSFSQLGAYISKVFLSKNDNFLKAFNKHIFRCKPNIVTLSTDERIALNPIVHQIKKIAYNSVIIDELSTSNERYSNLTPGEIFKLDKQWREEKEVETQPLIQSVLSNRASKLLAQHRRSSEGLYLEMIVMNKHGVNVALSDISSDFWQGDESKFINTYSKDSSTPFIDDITYDESVRSFESQISLTIYDGDKKLGVIMVGIDIEKALEKENFYLLDRR